MVTFNLVKTLQIIGIVISSAVTLTGLYVIGKWTWINWIQEII